MPEPAFATIEAAWAAYRDQCDSLRAALLASELAADPANRIRAHRWLLQAQAAAYNLTIAPDPSQPQFFTGTVFEPNVYSWILPNADFLYRYAFVDGGGRFRIRARRGASHFLEAQTIGGFFGDPGLKLLATYDFDRFAAGPDSLIDIAVGPEPASDCPNWVATDPAFSVNTIIVREAFYDWTAETKSELRIEAVDPPQPKIPDAADFIRRLEAASRLMWFCHRTFSGGLSEQVLAKVGTNRFLLVDTSKDEHASNPSAGYVPAVYDIAPGQALIVEIDPPAARYWNIHLGDVWWQVTDFTNHYSSLNGHQAVRDRDGRVRVVIAHEDPGVANWLDPVGNPKGVALLRWYFADRYPEPVARLVARDRLMSELPHETATVTPEQRRRAIDLRRDAVLRRYGH